MAGAKKCNTSSGGDLNNRVFCCCFRLGSGGAMMVVCTGSYQGWIRKGVNIQQCFSPVQQLGQ